MSARRHGHPRHGSHGWGAGAGVFLALVATVVAFGSLLVWIAGALAGTLTGHRPVLVSLSDAGTVIAQLPITSMIPRARGPSRSAISCPSRP
jgi:hypothetical protein